MKKIIFLSTMMLVVFILSMMVACGGGGDSDDPQNPQGPQEILEPSESLQLTESGYFDGLLYYKVTSNSTNEVAVVKVETSAITVVIPSKVIIDGKMYKCTRINDGAFKYLENISSITIPNTITSIGRDAFKGCNQLSNVYISDIGAWCNISFASSANPLSKFTHLYLNGKEIVDLVIPNSVESIGNYAFSYFEGLTSVSIGSNVKSIGEEAFCRCSGLKSISIGNGVTSIGSKAFWGCYNLKSITIPSSTTTIGEGAFGLCDFLTSVKSEITSPFIVNDIFSEYTYENALLIVPNGTKYAYQTTVGWNKFYNIDSSDDNNAIFQIPSSFELITPEQTTSNFFDLSRESVNLMTSQPDYGGWPATVTYAVQISLTGKDGSWKELPTTYNTTHIQVNGDEMSLAILKAYRAANNNNNIIGVHTIFVRLRAYLSNYSNCLGECFSNVIQINVNVDESSATILNRDSLWVIGSCNGWLEPSPGNKQTLIDGGWFIEEMEFDCNVFEGIVVMPEGDLTFRFYAKLTGWDGGDSYGCKGEDEATGITLSPDGVYSGKSMNSKGSWTIKGFPGGMMRLTVDRNNNTVKFELLN